jgi:hypothetical protein
MQTEFSPHVSRSLRPALRRAHATRNQILIPSAEFLRVRCTGSRALAPQTRIADSENGVAYGRDGCPQLLFRDVTPPKRTASRHSYPH